ncbi:MAG: HAMP domain-containing histidine kinase [Clostridia bacterium]|nr:HAMP domain-containing histidine kinase [Clostridia bacterium]
MEYTRDLSKGMQIAALVHDLRTPMCAAAGAAQTALEAGGKDVSVQLQQILQAVGAMDRMLSMMSDEQKADSTFTGDMLRGELLAITAERAEARGQRLSIDLSTLRGMTLEADYAALCRLLINLLSNAIKYTPIGGQITLRAQIEHGWHVRRRVRFIVADNGMGMNKTFMRRMFEPYARAKETGHIPGRGLGLAIVRDMVRRMGGSLRVHSEQGRGTSFVVSIPVNSRKTN